MRGWSAIFVSFLLLGLAVWSFAWDGFGSSTVIAAVAAVVIFFRGVQGMEINEVGDPLAVIEFVKDPADAIVDSATERFGDWLDDRKAAEEPATGTGVNHRQALVDWLHDREEPAAFDPDATIARYIENRGAQPADAPATALAPASAAPVRGFGRKGL
jgi:hypothetical protein